MKMKVTPVWLAEGIGIDLKGTLFPILERYKILHDSGSIEPDFDLRDVLFNEMDLALITAAIVEYSSHWPKKKAVVKPHELLCVSRPFVDKLLKRYNLSVTIVARKPDALLRCPQPEWSQIDDGGSLSKTIGYRLIENNSFFYETMLNTNVTGLRECLRAELDYWVWWYFWFMADNYHQIAQTLNSSLSTAYKYCVFHNLDK